MPERQTTVEIDDAHLQVRGHLEDDRNLRQRVGLVYPNAPVGCLLLTAY